MKRLRHNASLRIPLLYALFGFGWIIFTDRLLLWLAPNLEQVARWQTFKGWLFVFSSTLLIALLLARAQRRQRQSENLYRLLFDNNPLPMWVYDLETLSFLKVNDAAVAKYGYTRAEFQQMGLGDIRPEEDVERLLDDVARTTSTLNFAGEWRHRRKDGSLFPVEIISHALTFDGRAARLVVVNDITERKQAEVALRESEQQFRTAVEEAPFPIIIHAEDGEILSLNRAWTDLSGYTSSDLPTIAEWIEQAYGSRQQVVKEDIERLYTLARRVKEGEYQITCKDGSQRIWDFSSTPLGQLPDGRQRVISMAADVTERKRAELALRQSETRYRRLFRQLRQVMDSVPAGVLLLATEGQILVANAQALEYLAPLAQAKIGDTLTHLGELPLRSVLNATRSETGQEVQAKGRIFNLLARPLESGPVAHGWVLVIRDVTEERTVAQQMEQQARLVAIGQLAAGIAHDFNNIIGVIILYVELIEKEATSAQIQEWLNTIGAQARQAAGLVEQILDFSRKALLERKDLDLVPLLREQVKLLRRILPHNIQVALETPNEGCIVRADATRLQQVVMNLAFNARDAMPDGGKLTLELAWWPAGPPAGSHLPDKETSEWIRLAVADTGEGIAPEFMDHVFEPFFTTKSAGKGTGLGLAQAHGIVGQHGGHISVASEPEVGTTFAIYLPARPATVDVP